MLVFLDFFQLEELGIQSEDQRRVYAGPAFASNLRREVVKRVQVVQNDIKLPIGDVFPFVLEDG
jgi:hypothetical protein